MPLYEYQCEDCENEFEEMLHFSERDDPLNTPCSFPTCGGKVHLKMRELYLMNLLNYQYELYKIKFLQIFLLLS